MIVVILELDTIVHYSNYIHALMQLLSLKNDLKICKDTKKNIHFN